MVVAALCYSQPLVRAWKRYQTRLLHPGVIIADDALPTANGRSLSISGNGEATYWSEQWHERTQLLNEVVAYLTERRWAKVVDPGWADRDLVIFCHPWTEVRVCTVQEDHGSGRRLIRARFQMRPRIGFWLAATALAVLSVATAFRLGALASVAAALGGALTLACVWWYAARRSGRAMSVFDHVANKLKMVVCQGASRSDKVAEANSARC